MTVSYVVNSLASSHDWSTLVKELGNEDSPVILATVQQLKALGVQSYVSESPYIDRDYSADYLHYYARTFRTYERHCTRIHFFSGDVAPFLGGGLLTSEFSNFSRAARDTYCGYCVVRPLTEAPIGRTVLSARLRGYSGMETTVTCRAQFDANLLGVELSVTGAAFLQQDARVGSCAQVAIWTGMRHMHAKYGYDWVSVADITRLAAPTAPDEAVSLPAGSEFLSSERMLRAIDAAGYQPLCIRTNCIARDILPYVDSGIPVIVGLEIGEQIGHAVTVVGKIFTKLQNPTNHPVDFISAYIVHDDQGGPYRVLPLPKSTGTFSFPSGDTIKRTNSSGTIDINATHATLAIVLMSPRVFLTAAAAEVGARDRIEPIMASLEQIREMFEESDLHVNSRLLDDVISAYNNDQLVLRTYLTSAAGYRRHIAGGTASDELKDALLRVHLPHFTWITEISTAETYNNTSAGMRRICGHSVIDATSTGRGRDDMLVLHLPGLLFTTQIGEDGKSPKETISIIENDDLYECREKSL